MRFSKVICLNSQQSGHQPYFKTTSVNSTIALLTSGFSKLILIA